MKTRQVPAARSGPPLRSGYVFAGVAFGLATLAALAWGASNAPSLWLARPDILDAESLRLMKAGQTASAAAITKRELALRPYDAPAWCRLAAARFAATGKPDDEVQNLLRKSYAAAAIDVDAFAWRSAFIFEHWPDIQPDVRQLATNEVRALDRIWETKTQVDRAEKSVRNPEGLFALKLLRRPWAKWAPE